MAEQPQTNEQGESPAPKKALPFKTLLILAGVLVLEVATVIVVIVVLAMSPSPAEVTAEDTVLDPKSSEREPIEAMIVEDKFDNLRTGETIIYDTEVYITVYPKHETSVTDTIEKMKARITTDIGIIFSRAQPAHFAEPTRATLTRQIHSAIDKRLGMDPDGKSKIGEVLIKKCTPFKADN